MSDSQIKTEKLEYDMGGTAAQGFVAYPAGGGKAPVVLVAHAWGGQSDFEREQAKMLAGLGYVGFAIDLFGGKTGSTTEACSALIEPFTDDRTKVRDAMLASVSAARTDLAEASNGQIAAIGFCFGGLCVLDLARAGADVRGVVSFHGLLFPNGLERQTITAKVLALHGNDDPMVPVDQANAFGVEMTEAGADWQLHVYGGTKHAFTNPNANDEALGTVYRELAATRGFAAMRGFLAEVLG